MIKSESTTSRALTNKKLTPDLCIVGGGLAGTCAAITAARSGIDVVLLQDRPILGGNASSEVRLWTLGATSHMGNNNRWAREGGLINELLTENLYRNPEGNALLFDALLLEKTIAEPKITLLLNTAAYEVTKSSDAHIESVKAFNSQNSTTYQITAPLFLDASGDGILGFLSGAAFRIGQERRGEFNELYAPEEPSPDLLGHSLYFMSKDTGRTTKFIPPAQALSMESVRALRRYRGFDSKSQACNYWWLEYGGHLDTIHDSEEIKQELWRVVYGVWNYIKNSGDYPEAATMTLEWVGHIPGKRESRRFEGDYMLVQQDIIEQRSHKDAVSFGGWAIDHHPVEGLYSKQSGCTQWHSKGVYQIPYRCLYSRNIKNLFLGGRIISASHIAFGSSRVMATCAHNAQAVAVAAAHCIRHQMEPKDLLEDGRMKALQQALLQGGQYIPNHALSTQGELAASAKISVSSTESLSCFPSNGMSEPLSDAQALMLPVKAGKLPEIIYQLDVSQTTTLDCQLRISSRMQNHTPDITLETINIPIQKGQTQSIALHFAQLIPHDCYAFVILMPNPQIKVHLSDSRRTGILTIYQKYDKKVAKTAAQEPPQGSGIDSFEFWIPQRRPNGCNPAISLSPALECFSHEQINNGITRPVRQSNAWVADHLDDAPTVTLEWSVPKTIQRIDLFFDGDYDHPMETVLWGHTESVVPFCVQSYQVVAEDGTELVTMHENHQSYNRHDLPNSVTTKKIRVVDLKTNNSIPPSVFEIRCY